MDKSCLKRLKLCVENVAGRKMMTPKDFEFLSGHIFSRLHVMISPTTIKRIWGYLQENTSPRVSTLDVLSKYVGYVDWSDYCVEQAKGDIVQSSFLNSRSLRADSLEVGDRVLVAWLPDRKCVFENCGGGEFTVVSSENSKLKVGGSFRCAAFIEGEPLYMDDLRQAGMPPMTYVAGKINGIRFEMIGK